MPEAKTKPTAQTAESFLDNLADQKVRDDCKILIGMTEKITGEPPVMWGPAIIGFGKYHFKYESGREGDICLIGFSPRKANITLYVLAGFENQAELLAKLGKHKASGGCLHINKLTDVNQQTLEEIINGAYEFKKNAHCR